MSLEHAILGFLNYESMTGYDIKKITDLSVSHFWHTAQSQIYRSLGHMEKVGWVESEIIAQDPRPPRKVYHLTANGKEELFRWLSEPQEPGEMRLSWLIQIFFGGRLKDDQVILLLEHQLNYQRERLRRYAAIPEENQATMSDDDPRERFFWLLTVDYGVAQTIAQVRWLEQALASIQQGTYNLTTLQK